MTAPHGRGVRTTPPSDETRQGSSPEQAASPTGVVGDAGTTQAGEDVRRRGWFWHWNSVVTQYAPLLGLKGVGLLNSYTVWTDRREESPHRGYAFPSQQREADFYGEDRAELITINKILVALDLIEIRKEMVLRADAQGRRWRVPHNFYRVKDHSDGFTLSTRDVMRVVELADRDKAVYRYVRRLFSPRFAPIDSDNVWHRIMPELRENEIWQRLAARAEREETKASARTRAGHAARRANLAEVTQLGSEPGPPTHTDTDNDSANDTTSGPDQTSVATTNAGLEVDVEATNNGSGPDVATANEGLDQFSSTAVDPINDGGPTDVDSTNTTYNQLRSTTTTTTRAIHEEGGSGDSGERLVNGMDTGSPVRGMEDVAASSGVVSRPDRAVPFDAPGEDAATQAFEDANARRSTPAERQLLRGLAERFDPAAASDGATGWEWVKAAIYEAVEAGSAFVAPRRLREILSRWEREGTRDGERGDGETARRPDGKPTRRSGGQGRDAGGSSAFEEGHHRTGPRDFSPSDRLAVSPSPPPDIPLPHGFGGHRTWAFTIGLLANSIDRERLVELTEGTAIVGYRDGEVTIGVPDPIRAEQLATTYRDLISRKLGEAMRRPVRIAVITTASDQSPDLSPEAVGVGNTSNQHAPTRANQEQAPPDVAPRAQDFVIQECGVPSRQVWAAVLAELTTRGDVSRANVDTWLRPAGIIGRGEDGAVIIGAPTKLAQRRITARFIPDLKACVAAVAGAPLDIEIVISAEWLRDHPDQG
ncbi:MAG TPA: hypothetical protein VGR16_05515, partial [Thermomicrobiales bacterium]|nr:hypothetical protein [Thermomicrobiales bacterium]